MIYYKSLQGRKQVTESPKILCFVFNYLLGSWFILSSKRLLWAGIPHAKIVDTVPLLSKKFGWSTNKPLYTLKIVRQVKVFIWAKLLALHEFAFHKGSPNLYNKRSKLLSSFNCNQLHFQSHWFMNYAWVNMCHVFLVQSNGSVCKIFHTKLMLPTSQHILWGRLLCWGEFSKKSPINF